MANTEDDFDILKMRTRGDMTMPVIVVVVLVVVRVEINYSGVVEGQR